MPQLDQVSFSSQVFWLLVIFFGLYFSILYYVVPNIAKTLKFRQKYIGILTTKNSSFADNYDALVEEALLKSKKSITEVENYISGLKSRLVLWSDLFKNRSNMVVNQSKLSLSHLRSLVLRGKVMSILNNSISK